MDFSIRKGEKADIPDLLRLVKELALYEKAPQEVTVSEEELEHDGFGQAPAFSFFVAEAEQGIVGIALYYIKYSTWKGKCIFLEDIIVDEPCRKCGIGKALFREVLKAARGINAKRLEWQVLEWNKPAIEFYKKLNAGFDHEWINCRLTEKQIRETEN